MLTADAEKELAVLHAIKNADGVSTQKVKSILPGEVVPEFFQPQGGVPLTFRPQKGDHLTKSDETAAGFCPGGGLAYQCTYGILEFRFIRSATDHEGGEGFSGVQVNK